MDTKDALFSEDQQKLLNELLSKLDKQQGLWLGGYLTGVNMASTANNNEAVQETTINTSTNSSSANNAGPKIKILFGSRTGNSKQAATDAYNKALSLGIGAELVDMNDYSARKLKKEKYVLFVVSTDGEGEPPLPAEDLHSFLHAKNAPKLSDLNYSVLALGDSSYKQYCQTGKDIDHRLEELGATRIYNRVDCDLDFTDTAQQWQDEVLNLLKSEVGTSEQIAKQATANAPKANDLYNIKSPLKAEVINKVKLNGQGSNKETLHVELSIEDSGLTYEPGDSLSIISPNRKELVNDILEITNIRKDSLIKIGEREVNIVDALTHEYEITVLTRDVLDKYSQYLLTDGLNKVLSDDDYLADFIYGRDLLDLLTEFPTILSPNEFISILRKMQPRQYSIASSYNANPEEVHLTIGAVRYERNSRLHNGKASTFVADQIDTNDPLSVFVSKNESFRLPKTTSTPIIMVGSGTGIAPFRSFLQEREISENAGKSWLFFGEQHFATDFLYQTDFQKYLKKGVLTQMDVAFSRDQEHKVYVQNKIEASSREVFHWLEDGAHFYLCGDKDTMAKDVKSALINVIRKEGKLEQKAAEDYFKQLRKAGRFQEDIY